MWDISSITRVFAPRSVKILDGMSAGETAREEDILFASSTVFDVLPNIVRCDGQDKWILRILKQFHQQPVPLIGYVKCKETGLLTHLSC